MAISKFYINSVVIKRKARADVGGVVKETVNVIATLKGALQKTPSSYAYQFDKETFDMSYILQVPTNTDILEDDLLEVDGKDYDVLSVVDGLNGRSHLECILNRSS